jgi:hypothetical protein
VRMCASLADVRCQWANLIWFGPVGDPDPQTTNRRVGMAPGWRSRGSGVVAEEGQTECPACCMS